MPVVVSDLEGLPTVYGGTTGPDMAGLAIPTHKVKGSVATPIAQGPDEGGLPIVVAGIPTFSNVSFLLHGTSLPWYDTGYTGWGVENRSAVVDLAVKPFGIGSFYTGAAAGHAKGARVPVSSGLKLGTKFSIEARVFCSAAGARIFDTRNNPSDSNGWTLTVQATTGYIIFGYGGTNYGLSSPVPSMGVPANKWTKCQFTYDGLTARVFLDGVLVWTAPASINVTTGNHLTIANTGDFLNGIADQYLTEMRIVKGEPVDVLPYTVTPIPLPDSGLTVDYAANVSYANVILRSTYDANVNDVSSYARTMTANGGAAVSSAQFVFGGGSLLLNGSGGYLSTPDAAEFDLGAGDYQLQAWVRRNGSAVSKSILSCYQNSTTGYNLSVTTSNVPNWNETGDGIDGTFVSVLADLTWTHLAVGRKDGILYTFFDGVLERFVSDSQTTNCSATMFVGRLNNTFPQDWPGNIEDIQLVKGECQLFRTFLRPKQALPVV